MRRRDAYGLTGAALALGAPAGLLLLRAARAGMLSWKWAGREVGGDLATYVYLAVSTVLVFALFGCLLGRQADRLSDLSRTDSLTGLRNRRDFEDRLEEEFSRALRYEEPLSLLLLDLDGLKDVNDRGGHRAGDAALCRVAAALRGGSRASDITARWGGDEFVLLAPRTGADEARGLAERVCALAATAESSGLGITISVGVATDSPGRRHDASESLVRSADAALYAAKKAGRNCVVTA